MGLLLYYQSLRPADILRLPQRIRVPVADRADDAHGSPRIETGRVIAHGSPRIETGRVIAHGSPRIETGWVIAHGLPRIETDGHGSLSGHDTNDL
ncbi:hypothetical protein [Roseiflexus castenholzii]|uniref:hypothetical protein n=1 Tax=Roseiflexus castenholzii TaxID=120962 RepID=UPI003C7E3FAC